MRFRVIGQHKVHLEANKSFCMKLGTQTESSPISLSLLTSKRATCRTVQNNQTTPGDTSSTPTKCEVVLPTVQRDRGVSFTRLGFVPILVTDRRQIQNQKHVWQHQKEKKNDTRQGLVQPTLTSFCLQVFCKQL